jgi:hypothetical protein
LISDISSQAFRDDQGNPTNHPGLRLQLSDFACKELIEDAIRDGGQEILLSTQQLCQYLTTAEDRVRGYRVGIKSSILPGVQKRKRSETPPERMASGDEAKYIEQEERAAKRMEDNDPNYE